MRGIEIETETEVQREICKCIYCISGQEEGQGRKEPLENIQNLDEGSHLGLPIGITWRLFTTTPMPGPHEHRAAQGNGSALVPWPPCILHIGHEARPNHSR